MKGWCDLGWKEKCDIEKGKVNPYSYLTGYTFDVKTKVQEGQEVNRRGKDGGRDASLGVRKE